MQLQEVFSEKEKDLDVYLQTHKFTAPLGVFQENRFMTDLRTGAAGAVVSLRGTKCMCIDSDHSFIDPGYEVLHVAGTGSCRLHWLRSDREE